MKYADNMSELIGRTPMVKINNLNPEFSNTIFAKLEFFNPLHSVKDRTAYSMIKTAFKSERLKKGGVVIEPTSGNTGIALAWLSVIFGFKLILIMPETMSIERRKILKFFGAELILTPGELGMRGAIEKAYEILSLNPDYFMPMQFENIANVEIHYNTTGPEIWDSLDGKVDILICGVGTGGTITGAGKFLKEKKENIKIVAVEPDNSAILSGKKKGLHKIQGIGAGFIPAILDKNLIDEIITISDENAKEFSVRLAREEGIFAGISSGAVMKAAFDISFENKNKNIVVILPDTAERYISSYLFEGI